jgi:hypothetical protein
MVRQEPHPPVRQSGSARLLPSAMPGSARLPPSNFCIVRESTPTDANRFALLERLCHKVLVGLGFCGGRKPCSERPLRRSTG